MMRSLSTYVGSWSRDSAATLMVDGQAEAYVVSDDFEFVFSDNVVSEFTHLPSSAWGATSPIIASSDIFFLRKTNSGDIRNNEMLITNGRAVYYWSVDDGDFSGALSTPGLLLESDDIDDQAICWSPDGSKFYTDKYDADTDVYYIYVYTRQNKEKDI
jgi:hypothetical protein